MCDQSCSQRDLLPLAAPGDPRCLLRYTEVESYSERANWLRAGVLGANDGLVSVASIMLGVGAGNADLHTLLLSGLSALVAGTVTADGGTLCACLGICAHAHAASACM